jgi:hypothetical protein
MPVARRSAPVPLVPVLLMAMQSMLVELRRQARALQV